MMRITSRALLAGFAATILAIVPAAGQVTEAPALAPPPSLQGPRTSSTTLANGLTIISAELNELPLVRARLVIHGGARLDGDRAGIASLTADMLDEGAAGRDALEISEDLASLGASLETSATWDAFTVDVSAPTRTIAGALEILSQVVLQPTFAGADIARQRENRLAQIVQERDQPAAVAALVFNREVYPRAHPYHSPLRGDSANIVAFDSAAISEFWRRAAHPQRASLVVSGDITHAEVVELAGKYLGSWPTVAEPLSLPPTEGQVHAGGSRRILLVDKPDAPQSMIYIGAPGPARTSPDYPAVMLMNTILGGSFSARLNDILREQKGYTYGARSAFVWRPVPGPFYSSSAVRTEVTDSALAIFFSEFDRIREEPVPIGELERARAYSVLGAMDDFETTGQVVQQISSALAFELDVDRVVSELEQIPNVTAAEVQRAARAYIDPDRLTIVVVGDLDRIRAGIEALDLGPISIVEP